MTGQDRVEFQRDFYQLLLQMDSVNLQLILVELLQLVVAASGADRGYIEIRDAGDICKFESIHIPGDELLEIQQTISTGIIAEAINSGEVLSVPSAMVDPRFRTFKSVQLQKIQSVLCVPFFSTRAKGVLYLQGDTPIDSNENLRLDAELFATHVSPLLDSFLDELGRQESPEQETLLDKFDTGALIFQSEAMLAVLREAAMISKLDVPTLILGETGSGKTELARLIHKNSPRASAPLVEINCGAIPSELLESELFGAIRGAHSTAHKDLPGKIHAADGGTLFLDEVADLPFSAQAKLLQFLQSGQYYPLGSNKTVQSNVRVICATNQNLESMVKKKLFREDLFYRINTFEIFLPGLSARQTDLPVMVEFLVRDCCQKFGLKLLHADDEFIQTLSQIEIPGNVRQLKSLVERACIQANGLGVSTISAKFLSHISERNRMTDTNDFHTETLRFQSQLLKQSLDKNSWNVSKTARELNLSRSHVHNLIRQFRLERNTDNNYSLPGN